MDGGTLFQIRNLINRRNVVKDPTKNMNACEDFFTLLTESHILSAAMTVFEMSSFEDKPSETLFPSNSLKLGPIERQKLMMTAVDKIIEKYVRTHVPTKDNER